MVEEQREARTKRVLGKSCICHELGGSAQACHDIRPAADAAICPGPQIADFSGTYTLVQMMDHIYGRKMIASRPDRPHMLIRELKINMERLEKEKKDAALGLEISNDAYFTEYVANLKMGIEYYKQLAENLPADEQERFKLHLEQAKQSLKQNEQSS